MNLSLYNPHWKGGWKYEVTFHRKLFSTLKTKLGSRFVQVLIGLRRTGKTTLMRQCIQYLIENGTEKSHILFWSFDSGGVLSDVLDQFASASGVDFYQQECYVFLDEIQKLSDRQNQIKIYYDLYPKIHFFVSGSASVWVKKIESLAGRIEQYFLQPLSWNEYLNHQGLQVLLEKPLLHKEELVKYFEHFIHRQFFDTLSMPIQEVKEYMHNLTQKILFEDMVPYYAIRFPDLLRRIFAIYMQKPGMLLDYSALGNDLKVDARTVQTYTHFLEENLLITKLDNYSPNPLTKEKKLKRVYPSAPALSFLDHCTGELFETFWVQTLGGKAFWREGKKEIDIITTENNELHCYECKYRDEQKKGDLNAFEIFQKKHPHAQGVLLTQASLREVS